MNIRIIPFERLIEQDKNPRGVFAKKWEVCVECNSLEEAEKLKETLAQPEQEPVAMRYDFNGYGYSYIDNGSGSNWREKIKNAEPLYTAPSQRTWVGLTDKEIDLLNYVQVEGCQCSLCYIDGVEEFARAIEAKLREKNGC